ncbi:prenyltransferase [Streptomyces finlayi]|uniref:Prenyltransferase n=1 Tax=Streptomyces finlayi TaxID=67296 RepID=A0A7G7BEN6_9ACTN|nr:UbiA family prenyltransferase [Streptomyces finlayi]QNE73801.1 prenyltransferase [Streptomyces finlayi]
MRLSRWGGAAGLLLLLTAVGLARGDRPARYGPVPESPAATDGLSGAGGTAPVPDRLRTTTLREEAGAWAELLRVSALFTVPGDALAGAAAIGRRPDRGTALAVGASLCLYEAGMALNDWADREEDAVDRPHRPIPSGRVAPGAALAAAGALTAAGLALAARAGRPSCAVASALAATVWSYDLYLKHTEAGPAAMATARSLDLLLGATATARAAATATASAAARAPAARNAPAAPSVRAALPAAALLGAHTYAVTLVSRHEAQGGSTTAPLGALAATLALGAAVASERRRPGRAAGAPARLLLTAFAGAYLRTAAPPHLHAALNPSPPLTQRAVGGGIRAMIPLQAGLAARAGAPVTALVLMGLVPLARTFARKVSPT